MESGSGKESLSDVRNMMSWRVPHVMIRRISPNKSEDIIETNPVSVFIPNYQKDEHATNNQGSNYEDSMDSELSKSVNTEITESSHNLPNFVEHESQNGHKESRFWRILFGNINRLLEELYNLCEEEMNDEKCEDLLHILENAIARFLILRQRLEAYKVPMIKQQGGVSWEVRIPRYSSRRQDRLLSKYPDGIINGEKYVTSARPIGGDSNIYDQNITQENADDKPPVFMSKLRVSAPPFTPSAVKSRATTSDASSHSQKDNGENTAATATTLTPVVNSSILKLSAAATSESQEMVSIPSGEAPSPSLKPDVLVEKRESTTMPENPVQIESSRSVAPVGAKQDPQLLKPIAAAPLRARSVSETTTARPPPKAPAVVSNASIDLGSPAVQAPLPRKAPLPIATITASAAGAHSAHPRNSSVASAKTAFSSTAPSRPRSAPLDSPSSTHIVPVNAKKVTPSKHTDDWDEETETAVEAASEKIWAAVEAWVEAEARAEEEAWHLLQLDNSRKQAQSQGTALDFSIATTTDSNRKYNDSFLSASNQEEIELLSLSIDTDEVVLGATESPSSSPSINGSPVVPVTKVSSPPTQDKDYLSPRGPRAPSPLARFLVSRMSPISNLEFSPTSSSMSATASPRSYGSHPERAMYLKLSTPERKRLSPEEALRKLSAKQEAALNNRSQYVSERIEKARQNASRVQAVAAWAAQKTAYAEQIYLEKQREAMKRREEYVAQIKGKANNENAKVSEVMFINSLNAEAVGQELQQKLSEVEARIVAGRQRRTEILENITGRQRRRGQQMSAVRHQLEKDRMERWERLQNRMIIVNDRRKQRIQEMQRNQNFPNLSSEDSVPLEVNKTEKAIAETPLSELDHSSTGEELNENISKEFSNGTGQENQAAVTVQSSKRNKKDKSKKEKVVKMSDEEILNSYLAQQTVELEKNKDRLELSVVVDKFKDGYHQHEGKLRRELEEFLLRQIAGVSAPGKNETSSVTKLLMDFHNRFLDGMKEGEEQHLNVNSSETRSSCNDEKSLEIGGESSEKKKRKKKKKGTANREPSGPFVFIPWTEVKDSIPHIFHSVQSGKPATIDSFLSEGGIVIVRVLLDRHLGVLRDGATWKEIWSSKSIRDGLSAALEALSTSIYRGGPGVETIVTTGLHLSLLDMCQVLLVGLEKWQRERCRLVGQKSHLSGKTASKKSSTNRIKSSDTAVNTSPQTKAALEWADELTPLATFVTVLLTLFSSANKLLKERIRSGEPRIPGLLEKSLYECVQTKEFLELLKSMIDSISRSEVVLSQTPLPDSMQKEVIHQLTCRQIKFVSNCVSFLRLFQEATAGSDAFTSVPMSCANVIQMLRESEAASTLIDMIGSLLLQGRSSRRNINRDSAGTTAPSLPALQLCEFSLDGLCSLGRLDVSLVQCLAADIMLSLSHSADRLLECIVPNLDKFLTTASSSSSSVIKTYSRTTNNADHEVDHSVEELKMNNEVEVGDAIIGYLLRLISLMTNRCEENKIVFGRGPIPTVLSRLCNMPVRYFSDERLKLQLIPCLASLCLNCEGNLSALKTSIGPQIISNYFQRMRLFDEQVNQATVARHILDSNRSENATVLMKNVIYSVSCYFPRDLWNDAESYFK